MTRRAGASGPCWRNPFRLSSCPTRQEANHDLFIGSSSARRRDARPSGHASIDPVRHQSELVLRRSLEQIRTLTDVEDFAAAVAKGLLRGSPCETTDNLARASRSEAVSLR